MRDVTRRSLIRGATLAGSAVALGIFASASAQTKASKQQAKYQDQPKGGQRCSGCLNFMPPASCRVVDGTISPDGWCQLFAAKSG